MSLSIEIVYIHVPIPGEYYHDAERYVRTYLATVPSTPHTHTVIWNTPCKDLRGMRLFSTIQNAQMFQYDNTGWDIGAFIEVAKRSSADMLVCFGSSVHFHRRGWLERFVQAWNKYGPGLYGASSSFEISPHLNTTGFCCSPSMLASYPYKVETKQDRYNFEHGHYNACIGLVGKDSGVRRTFWKWLHRAGVPVMLVTWDGEWEWWDWRNPQNIFRRGDQSNMLIHWKHSVGWASSSEDLKRLSSVGTDLLMDPCFNLGEHTYTNHRSCVTPEAYRNREAFYRAYMAAHGI